MIRATLRLTIGLLCGVGTVSAAEVGYYSQPALHGDRLVFVSEGDLWTATLPPGDGEPITAWRLTSSDGSEARPQLSPDGRWIAFTGEYEGNTDVYVMPVDGGSPTRLTFHPSPDVALAWTPDGNSVLFRSSRAHPLGRWELWRVSPSGGMPRAYGFGQCSLVAVSSTGRRLAFTRWSNENWTWKRYRGGTAPEIWIGDLSAEQFEPLTDDPANDLFPMWVLGRVYFLSDRTGAPNIFSIEPSGRGPKQHTSFGPVADDPTAIGGYDVRWPSVDARRRGSRIVFCQAGGLALFDARDESVRRLDVRLASDRVAARRRFADPVETVTEYALSPEGDHLLIGSRGELLNCPVKSGAARQLTHTSAGREWGAAWLGEDQLVMITDVTGEQQVAVGPADGARLPGLVTEDRDVWLFPPAGAPDGKWVAFGDKTLRLHVLDMITLERRQADASEAGEITDYRFSPDSQWLAYVKPMPNGYGMIYIHSLRTGRSFAVSDGWHDDREPRWDPAGKYLYFLSRRHLDPLMGELDFEHIYVNTTQVYAVALAAETPPPLPEVARSVDFDLEAWAKGPPEGPDDEGDVEEGIDEPVEPRDPHAPDESLAMVVDTEGLANRHFLLPIEPGNYRRLEALWGAVVYLSEPAQGLLERRRQRSGLAGGGAMLHRYDLVGEESSTLAEKISGYAVSRDRGTVAWPAEEGFLVRAVAGKEEPEKVDVKAQRLRIDIRQEWQHIFEEAWRLQRDFYWAPNYAGVDWPAMRVKYAALLPRVGTRRELNRLIGEMIGELGTSHTYVWGGQEHDEIEPVAVGMLGADIEFDGRAFRLQRILPRVSWDEALASPLAAPYLDVEEGNVIVAVNGVDLNPGSNIYDLLQDQAGKTIRLTIADEPRGANRRTLEVKALAGEGQLRYAAWVDGNRRYVEETSDGRIGYLHIPDMGGSGLVTFSRSFHPQIERKALVVDVRDNGGGFVSQMIVQRLNRKVWAFMRPRQGVTERYPQKSLYGHMAVLIDQHAGSDGDIFPESFRLNDMGPLIGTRTWGGVVGIRGDKPFVDSGMSTQPEFAWWEPKRGWSLENSGVTPDIEVVITPQDRLAGRDPQLEKAVEVLMTKLEEDPKELPAPPPWPVHGQPRR
ncbi:MAG: S41 family peptidase [Planctomycetota bacterium]|jgi:tricorn protease